MRTGRRRLALQVLALATSAIFSFVFAGDAQWQIALRALSVVVFAGTLLYLAGSEVTAFFRRRRRVRFRGVERVGLEHMREAEFVDVWMRARTKVLCFGSVMSHASNEEDLIARTVARGVRVEFVMLDPRWLRRQAELHVSLDKYYDGDAVRAAQASYQRLRDIERRLNRTYGADHVKLRTYQQLSLMSATIADPDQPDAYGVIEFHLFRGAGRYRMIASNYLDDGTNTPLIAGVLDAIGKVLRQPRDEAIDLTDPAVRSRGRKGRQDPGGDPD
jgi:hypothetical protein